MTPHEPSTLRHPTQPLENRGDGVLRFKPNAIVRFMLDTLRNLGAFDLNKAAVMEFSDEDRRQFAQLIGYSLGGYEELSYCEPDIRERVAHAEPGEGARDAASFKATLVDTLHKMYYGTMVDNVSDADLFREAEGLLAKYYDPDPSGLKAAPREADTPLGPDAVAASMAYPDKTETHPLSKIAAMAVDLGPANLSETFRSREADAAGPPDALEAARFSLLAEDFIARSDPKLFPVARVAVREFGAYLDRVRASRPVSEQESR